VESALASWKFCQKKQDRKIKMQSLEKRNEKRLFS